MAALEGEWRRREAARAAEAAALRGDLAAAHEGAKRVRYLGLGGRS